MKITNYLPRQRITLTTLHNIGNEFVGVIDEVTAREVRNAHGGESNEPVRELRLTLEFPPDDFSPSGWLIELRDSVVTLLGNELGHETDDWHGAKIRITPCPMPDNTGRQMKNFEVVEHPVK